MSGQPRVEVARQPGAEGSLPIGSPEADAVLRHEDVALKVPSAAAKPLRRGQKKE